jgi:DNA-directed RNA polymerase specialized sigma24 family protein
MSAEQHAIRGTLRAGRLDSFAKQALDRSFRDIRPGVNKFVGSRVRKAGPFPVTLDSDDIVQESFCRTIAAVANGVCDSHGPIAPYVFGIARNVVADWRRTTLRFRRVELRAAADRTSSGEGAFGLFHAFEIVKRAEAWLTDQPSILGEVWRRRFVAGETERKVSSQLGISRRQLNTIETSLRKALRAHLRIE